MKLRTAEMLCDKVAEELSWRKKELTDLKYLIQNASTSSSRKRVLGRSGIALLYAHWEGFVKKSGTYYLEFIRMQRLINSELSNSIMSLIICQQITKGSLSKRPSQYEWIFDFFNNKMSERAIFNYKDAIDVGSNLSSKVLREIVFILGLDYSYYETLEKLLDSSLLGRRNSIAHGEIEPIDLPDYLELHERIIEMMNYFRNQIENAAINGDYKIKTNTALNVALNE